MPSQSSCKQREPVLMSSYILSIRKCCWFCVFVTFLLLWLNTTTKVCVCSRVCVCVQLSGLCLQKDKSFSWQQTGIAAGAGAGSWELTTSNTSIDQNELAAACNFYSESCNRQHTSSSKVPYLSFPKPCYQLETKYHSNYPTLHSKYFPTSHADHYLYCYSGSKQALQSLHTPSLTSSTVGSLKLGYWWSCA